MSLKTLTSLYPPFVNIYSFDGQIPVDAAGEKGALIFIIPASGNLQAFAAYYGAGSGTRDAYAECYSVVGGLPNTDLGASYDETSFTPGTNSSSVATLDNALAVTAGTQMAFVLTNNNGTPASNYFGMGTNLPASGAFSLHYDGTVWRSVGNCALNLKISDAWYGGKCIRRIRNSLTGMKMYNDTGSPNTIRRAGFIFRPVSSCYLCEVTLFLLKSGTVTGDWIEVEIWQANTLVATSTTKISSGLVTQTTATASTAFGFAFNEVPLTAGTEYRIVARLVGADALDSSNYLLLAGSDSIVSTAWPDDANVTDGYLGGTYSSVETPTSSDWTDYRTSSTVALPTVYLAGYIPASAGGARLVGPSALVG